MYIFINESKICGKCEKCTIKNYILEIKGNFIELQSVANIIYIKITFGGIRNKITDFWWNI